MFTVKKQRKLTSVLFFCYFMTLVFIVLLKLGNIPHIRSINLIPYAASGFEIEHFGGWAIREIGYNILVFVPLGVYSALFHLKHYQLIPLCVSLLFEALQFIFAIGVTDVTDVIGNTLGGLLGMGFWMCIQKLFPQKGEAIVNGSASGFMTAGILLFAILFIRNL